jgi:predicted ATPase/DNA-binding SARP family transcriptional activator
MRFAALGPLEAYGSSGRLDIGPPQRRAVLALLLQSANKVVSVDVLVEALWPDREVSSAAGSLHSHISRLRSSLGHKTIATRSGGYVLHLSPDDFDVAVFDNLAVEGHEALSSGAIAFGRDRLTQALTLWRGDAFQDFIYQDWSQTEIARLTEARLAVLGARIEANLMLGNFAQVLGEVESLTADHPEREAFCRQLMICRATTGRRREALRAYEVYRQTSLDVAGLPPSSELEILHEMIVGGQSVRPMPPTCALVLPPERVVVLIAVAFPPARTHDLDHSDIEAVVRKYAFRSVTGQESAHVAICDGPTEAIELVASLLSEARTAESCEGIGVDVATLSPAAVDGGELAIRKVAHLARQCERGGLLASRTAVDLLGTKLEFNGARLEDDGFLQLPGLIEPEYVYRLHFAGIPTQGHGLPSRRRQHNLRWHPRTFVGRTREISFVSRLLGPGRVVTIIGPRGSGKSRLAEQVASGHVGARADGVWWADLSDANDEGSVMSAICTALGTVAPVGPIRSDWLAETLKNRDLLLVLDNCERVIERVAGLVEAVAERCPLATILATTREPLALPTEVVWRIPPMDLPSHADMAAARTADADSMMLFACRAAEVAEFTLNADNFLLVEDICRRLDSRPLAIELAALQLADMSLDQLRTLIESPPSNSKATMLDQHASSSVGFRVSYDRLTPAEQCILRALAIFSAPIRREDLRIVVDGGASASNTDAAVNVLTTKGLLDRNSLSDTNYRMLDSVRFSVLSEPGGVQSELEEIRTRHAQHFASIASEAGHGRFEDDAQWLDVLDQCYPNVTQAIAWCVDHETALAADALLGVAWYHLRSLGPPSATWIRLANGVIERDVLDAEKASLLRARLACVQARARPSRRVRDLAYSVVGDPHATPEAVLNARLALLDLAHAGFDDVAGCCAAALEAARVTRPPDEERLRAGLSYVLAYVNGDFDEARAQMLIQQREARRRRLTSLEALTFMSLADLDRVCGDRHAALNDVRKALDAAERAGNRGSHVWILVTAAEITLWTSAPRTAARAALDAADAAERIDHVVAQLYAYVILSASCARLGALHPCARAYGLALRRRPRNVDGWQQWDSHVAEIEAVLSAANLSPDVADASPDSVVLSEIRQQISCDADR